MNLKNSNVRGLSLAETMVALAVTSLILAAAVASMRVISTMRQKKVVENEIARQAEDILSLMTNDIAEASRISRVQRRIIPAKEFNSVRAEEVFQPGQMVLVLPSWSDASGLLTGEICIVGYVWDGAHTLTRIEVPHLIKQGSETISYVPPRITVVSRDVTAFELMDDKNQPTQMQFGLRARFTLTRGAFRRDFGAFVAFRNGGVI